MNKAVAVRWVCPQKNNRSYWLKLPYNFFHDPVIKKLRGMAGGNTYVCIYLKIQLMAINNTGIIYYEGIENSLEKELALKLDENEDNIKATLIFLEGFNLIEKLDEKEFLLTKVPSSIVSESVSAKKMRIHRKRKKIEEKKQKLRKYIDLEKTQNNSNMTNFNISESHCDHDVTHCDRDVTRCDHDVTQHNYGTETKNNDNIQIIKSSTKVEANKVDLDTEILCSEKEM